jgi:hypothetical protein
MSGVLGLRGTGNFAADERPKDYREFILFREPNGDAPIFALTAKGKKRVVTDPEYNWWDEPQDLVRMQVNGAVGNTAADQLIVVDSLDPTAAAPTRQWGTATHLKSGDLLFVESTDSVSFAQEIIEVDQVLSDTSFTVKRGAAGSTIAAIGNDAYLTLIGSVHPEGTAAPQAVSRNPVKYNNYTQIFKDSYELTGTVLATKFRTGEPWSNDKKRKMWDHSRAIELSMLLSKPSETTGDNGKPKRTMGGILYQIPSGNRYVYSTGTTIFDLLDRMSVVFNYSSRAGNERAVFAGNGALNALNKIIAADPNGEIQWGGMERVYGMNFRELVFPQGRFLVKTHPLLSRFGGYYTNSMFLLDMSAITYVTLKGRDTKVKDDVQADDEDVRRGFIQTECSVEVDMGGVTCGYIGNVNYSP